ncbi:MAG: T9SS type A sorting domain-containing protein [Flavobacteriales bacterium]
MGLVVYESTSEGKEYAQGLLTEPLQQGESYCIGIWISLADSSALKSCDFQVSFTNESIQGEEILNLMLQNGVSFNISEIDTASWTYFESSYMALGGEQFIYLGSNTPNSELTCVEQVAETWLWNTSYILVDNVSVKAAKLCELSAEEILKTSVTLVYPNPTSGLVNLPPSIEGKWELKIYGYNGTLLSHENHNNSNKSIDISNLTSSVYMLEISDSNGTFRTMVIKE